MSLILPAKNLPSSRTTYFATRAARTKPRTGTKTGVIRHLMIVAHGLLIQSSVSISIAIIKLQCPSGNACLCRNVYRTPPDVHDAVCLIVAVMAHADVAAESDERR